MGARGTGTGSGSRGREATQERKELVHGKRGARKPGACPEGPAGRDGDAECLAAALRRENPTDPNIPLSTRPNDFDDRTLIDVSRSAHHTDFDADPDLPRSTRPEDFDDRANTTRSTLPADVDDRTLTTRSTRPQTLTTEPSHQQQAQIIIEQTHALLVVGRSKKNQRRRWSTLAFDGDGPQECTNDDDNLDQIVTTPDQGLGARVHSGIRSSLAQT